MNQCTRTRFIRHWHHRLELYLCPLVGSIIFIRIWFSDSFNLHMKVYINFLKSALRVGSPRLTNNWLALCHLGTCNNSLRASLYATFSLCMDLAMYLHHRWAVYNGVQYALNREALTSEEQIKNLLLSMLACA